MEIIIEKHKQILLKTFEAFSAFCDEHKLTYYVAYGTCIGAVRHNGLIPWDDDIDVWMPRADYEKLLSLDITHTDYEIIRPFSKNYYLTFAKWCDKNSTIQEFERFNCIFGVFIDIFPIDKINSEDNSVKTLYNIHKKLFFTYAKTLNTYPCFNGNVKQTISNGIRNIFNFVFGKPIGKIVLLPIIKNVQKKITSKNNANCDSFVCFIETTRLYIFPNSAIEEKMLLPFEQFSTYVPKGYDTCLKMIFGDYMTPPPENQRVIHHSLYYANLEKKVTLSDIKREMSCSH